MHGVVVAGVAAAAASAMDRYIPDSEKPGLGSLAGVKFRLEEAKSVAKSSYSSAFIQRHLPSFSHRVFPTVAHDVFSR